MVRIDSPIMEAVLYEDADDMVVDEMIDAGGVDTSELTEDDFYPSTDEPSDDITDIDILAGDVTGDIPDDAEVPDINDLPTERDLREVERASKELLYSEIEDSDDDSIVNYAVYNDANPDTEEVEIPEWAKDMDTSPGSYVPPKIERITYDDMMESATFEEFLEKSYKRSIIESDPNIPTWDSSHNPSKEDPTDGPV